MREVDRETKRKSREMKAVEVWSRNSLSLPVWIKFLFKTQIMNFLLC